MAEWLVEAGIGEDRAVLVEVGGVVEARIERHDVMLRLGAVHEARLKAKAGRAGRAEVAVAGGIALLGSVPLGLTEGALLHVEVIREAIPERGNPKLPLVRQTAEAPRPAPRLIDQPGARLLRAHEPDELEAAGWSELIEQAETGLVPFSGGLLRIALTPAMTLIDVDGELPPTELALRGATAAAQAIRRFDIGGSIGIDLPTLPSKQARQAAADAVDAALPQPFERTAVNGFGFLQIVRRRVRPSLLELVQSDPATASALALLRCLEREPPGEVVIPASVAVGSEWIEELQRRRGQRVVRS